MFCNDPDTELESVPGLMSSLMTYLGQSDILNPSLRKDITSCPRRKST